MPGWTIDQCFPDKLRDGTPVPFGGHLNKCRHKSIYKDGIWRWFFASCRCNCWCHRAYLDPMEAAEVDLHFTWFKWGYFGFFVMLFSFFFVILPRLT